MRLWKCRPVESQENQNPVSLPSHRPWKSLRDSHIPTVSTMMSLFTPKERTRTPPPTLQAHPSMRKCCSSPPSKQRFRKVGERDLGLRQKSRFGIWRGAERQKRRRRVCVVSILGKMQRCKDRCGAVATRVSTGVGTSGPERQPKEVLELHGGEDGMGAAMKIAEAV